MVRKLLLLFSIFFCLSSLADNVKLQVKDLLGKEYYCYEVKKGETIYGIAKKFGWNIDELVRINPDAARHLKKGDRLYYPTQEDNIVESQSSGEILDFEPEPIIHTVKKGETVYGLSRQYDLPLETIYRYHPSAKQGLKTGETLEFPQSKNSKFYFYRIKTGDSLYSVAQKFNTSIEGILKDNPRLSERNFKTGETIRIDLSNSGKLQSQRVEEERLAKVENYKVSKNDTWTSISEKTGVDEEILMAANDSENKNPKENQLIAVPISETVEIEKEVEINDVRELSSEGIQEIYDSIHGNNPDKEMLSEVRVALILDDPSSKKDIDFTRGFLIALSEMKETPFKINLKVIDGRVAASVLSDSLDFFEPNLILATADKAFPLFIADYGNSNNIQIVNVFDLKNDLYEDNASIVQLLPPSSYFYEHLAGRIRNDYRYGNLVMIGDNDSADGMAANLIEAFDGSYDSMSIEDFSIFEPDYDKTYIVYAYPTKKDEISDFFQAISNIKENFPMSEITVIGHSSWVALMDDFEDRFNENRVIIPARVWLDENGEQWGAFTSKYEEFFNGVPVRSFPNFAASGYDSAHYFLPVIAHNGGDFNKNHDGSNDFSLQSEIGLKRVNNWGGFINSSAFLIQFMPDGKPLKTLVK